MVKSYHRMARMPPALRSLSRSGLIISHPQAPHPVNPGRPIPAMTPTLKGSRLASRSQVDLEKLGRQRVGGPALPTTPLLQCGRVESPRPVVQPGFLYSLRSPDNTLLAKPSPDWIGNRTAYGWTMAEWLTHPKALNCCHLIIGIDRLRAIILHGFYD